MLVDLFWGFPKKRCCLRMFCKPLLSYRQRNVLCALDKNEYTTRSRKVTVRSSAMYGKVVAALICYLCVVVSWHSVVSQNDVDEVFNFSRRKSTTPDPILSFFANPSTCDHGQGVCIKECSDISLMRPDVGCGSILVCCSKEPDNAVNQPDNGFVFPTRPTTRPRTRPPAATTPRIRATRPTTTTTTTTTTEEPELPEEPFDPEDCGIGSSQEESRGQALADSIQGEFPWNVGIFSREKNVFGFNQDIFHCGGSIIDDFVVLTAASCVHNKDLSSLIVIGGIREVASKREKRQERTLEQAIKHPLFSHTSKIYDIAFLVLSDKFDYSRTINRICLPRLGISFRESNCLFTGWGDGTSSSVRPVMKTVELQLTDQRLCEDSIRRMIYKNVFKLRESFQCAEEETNTVNIGRMDVGSPLVCTVPGKDRQFYQVGIYSWSTFEPNVPSMFTNVTYFREWIDSQMKSINRLPYIYDPVENAENEEI